LLLTLVAFEDAWGQDEHNKKLHNLFGITQAGGNNLSFESDDKCIATGNCIRATGPRHPGSRPFIEAMKKIGYNSVNQAYYETFKKVYASVQKIQAPPARRNDETVRACESCAPASAAGLVATIHVAALSAVPDWEMSRTAG